MVREENREYWLLEITHILKLKTAERIQDCAEILACELDKSDGTWCSIGKAVFEIYSQKLTACWVFEVLTVKCL